MKTTRSNRSPIPARLAIAAALTLAGAHARAATLAVHWTFDDNPAANAQTIADVSGSTTQHDGTLGTSFANAATPGIIGGAFDFADAVTSNVSTDLTTDFVTGAGAASISLWINPDSISAQNFIFAWGKNSGGQNVRASIEINSSGGVVIRNRHQAGLIEWDASAITLDNGWHQLAMVVPDPDGDPTVGDFLIYIDGALATKLVDDTDTLNVQPNTITGAIPTGLYVGANYNSNTGLAGQIDDVGYFTGALTAQEILDIYNAGLNGQDLATALGIGGGDDDDDAGGASIPAPSALPAGLALFALAASRRRRGDG